MADKSIKIDYGSDTKEYQLEALPEQGVNGSGGVSPEEVTGIVKENFPGGVGYKETTELVIYEGVVNYNGWSTPRLCELPEGLQLGREYKVVCDGEERVFVAYDDNGYSTIGAPYKDYSEYELNIYVSDGVLSAIPKTKGKDYNIRISTMTYVVYPIEEQFIADTIPRKSDISAIVLERFSGGIGGETYEPHPNTKPMSVEVQAKVRDSGFPFFYSSDMNYMLGCLQGSNCVEVIWDGKSYMCESKEFGVNTIYVAGNASLLKGSDLKDTGMFDGVYLDTYEQNGRLIDTGEPFCLLFYSYYNVASAYFAKDTNMHTVTLTAIDKSTYKIDAKYLPTDYLTELINNASTSGDAELADIRVARDGTVYETAGEAVRGQIGQLSEEIGKQSEAIADKVNKTGITLGKNADGQIFIYVDGVAVGNGVEINGEIVEGDVFGYVDENNNIVLNGALADGTYTIKYEMEDGTVIDIGTLTFDVSVTNNLTNCTNSNSVTEVGKGESYSATISAKDGYALSSIVVTMGGTDITSTAVSGGVISIASVTGNIVITAIAKAGHYETVTEDITLTQKTSITLDGATRESTSGYCTTPYIDVSDIPKPCKINLTGAGWAYVDESNTGYIRVYIADINETKLTGTYTHVSRMPDGVTMTNGTDKVSSDREYSSAEITVTSNNVGKLRFAGNYTSVTPAGFDATVTQATLTYQKWIAD